MTERESHITQPIASKHQLLDALLRATAKDWYISLLEAYVMTLII